MVQGKETKDVLVLVQTVVKAANDALADGKINLADFPKLAPVVAAAREAWENSEQVPDELKEIFNDKELALALAKDVVAGVFQAILDVVERKIKDHES